MISVIIPTYNEAAHIRNTIMRLRDHDPLNLISEIIVADGGSNDNTLATAASVNALALPSPRKGRAAQMNFGAGKAKGSILYFLHADTIPPIGFTEDISKAINNGFTAGCYRLAFDHSHWFLQANCWFTRFDFDPVRFGDQSLFVKKSAFEEAGGFCEKHTVLEDQEFIKRLKKICSFTILPKSVTTSARKYLENGIYKTQGIFFIIYFMYRLGFSQQKLVETYRRLIRQNKI